jgi:hypothetical protein
VESLDSYGWTEDDMYLLDGECEGSMKSQNDEETWLEDDEDDKATESYRQSNWNNEDDWLEESCYDEEVDF